jgi:hypothetical protein
MGKGRRTQRGSVKSRARDADQLGFPTLAEHLAERNERLAAAARADWLSRRYFAGFALLLARIRVILISFDAPVGHV